VCAGGTIVALAEYLIRWHRVLVARKRINDAKTAMDRCYRAEQVNYSLIKIIFTQLMLLKLYKKNYDYFLYFKVKIS